MSSLPPEEEFLVFFHENVNVVSLGQELSRRSSRTFTVSNSLSLSLHAFGTTFPSFPFDVSAKDRVIFVLTYFIVEKMMPKLLCLSFTTPA